MGPAIDPVGLSRFQRPGFLVPPVGWCCDDFGDLLAPTVVVLWLRHPTVFADSVEEGQQGRAATEEIRRQIGQIDEGGVEERKLTVAVENRQPDGKLSEGLGKGLDKVALGDFGFHHCIHVHGVKDVDIANTDCADIIPVLGTFRRCLRGNALMPCLILGLLFQLEDGRLWFRGGAMQFSVQRFVSRVVPGDDPLGIYLPYGMRRRIAGAPEVLKFKLQGFELRRLRRGLPRFFEHVDPQKSAIARQAQGGGVFEVPGGNYRFPWPGALRLLRHFGKTAEKRFAQAAPVIEPRGQLIPFGGGIGGVVEMRPFEKKCDALLMPVLWRQRL